MEQSDPRSSSVTSAVMSTVSRYIKLLLEDTRLNVTEKLTRLLSALTVCALLLVLALATLLFLSLAAGQALADVMNPIWAYVIVASFYAVIAVVIFFCKTVLHVPCQNSVRIDGIAPFRISWISPDISTLAGVRIKI